MDPQAYDAFTAALQESLARRPDVQGLVALGSMAGRDYQPDEYSDHDFFVVVDPASAEPMRQDLSWLPRVRRRAAVLPRDGARPEGHLRRRPPAGAGRLHPAGARPGAGQPLPRPAGPGGCDDADGSRRAGHRAGGCGRRRRTRRCWGSCCPPCSSAWGGTCAVSVSAAATSCTPRRCATCWSCSSATCPASGAGCWTTWTRTVGSRRSTPTSAGRWSRRCRTRRHGPRCCCWTWPSRSCRSGWSRFPYDACAVVRSRLHHPR